MEKLRFENIITSKSSVFEIHQQDDIRLNPVSLIISNLNLLNSSFVESQFIPL
jgi:hypothetical protein